MKIPRIIHFIWAGGEGALPAKNVKVLLSWANANPSFKIWLWVDQKTASYDLKDYYTKALREAAGEFGDDQQYTPDQFIIRDIEDNTLEGNVGNKASHLVVRYEIKRLLPNYGASSDVLRYRILFQHGGAYFDSDVVTGPVSLANCSIFQDEDVNDNDQQLFYVDPRSQDQPFDASLFKQASAEDLKNMLPIGNDAFVCTPHHPLMKLIAECAIKNYSTYLLNPFGKELSEQDLTYTLVDTWLNRTITSYFLGKNPALYQAYSYDTYSYMERMTVLRTGPFCVREVVADLFNREVEVDDEKLILVKEIPDGVCRAHRALGQQWLKQRIPFVPKDEAIQRAIDSIAFEINVMDMLRIDTHIRNVADACRQHEASIIDDFLFALENLTQDLGFESVAQSTTTTTTTSSTSSSTTSSTSQPITWDKLKSQIKVLELTYRYPKSVAFLLRHGVSLSMSGHFFEKNCKHYKDDLHAIRGCLHTEELAHIKIPDNRRFKDLPDEQRKLIINRFIPDMVRFLQQVLLEIRTLTLKLYDQGGNQYDSTFQTLFTQLNVAIHCCQELIDANSSPSAVDAAATEASSSLGASTATGSSATASVAVDPNVSHASGTSQNSNDDPVTVQRHCAFEGYQRELSERPQEMLDSFMEYWEALYSELSSTYQEWFGLADFPRDVLTSLEPIQKCLQYISENISFYQGTQPGASSSPSSSSQFK